MHGVEALGLLKMDFLGLRNLSVIETALDLIEEATGTRPDIDAVALDDERDLRDAAPRRLDRGVPARGRRRCARRCARWRRRASTTSPRSSPCTGPGPMAGNMHRDYPELKNGRMPPRYIHPEMAEVLSDTYGLMLYQESVMRVARALRRLHRSRRRTTSARRAGRRTASSSPPSARSSSRAASLAATARRSARELFDIIEPFANYAFNKSHAYGYGLVAYQTAWLKANHPVEYLAALLSSVKDDKDHTAIYLGECRNLGIDVRVPDINESSSNFTARRAARAPGARA